jgi:hypothetical protein
MIMVEKKASNISRWKESDKYVPQLFMAERGSLKKIK